MICPNCGSRSVDSARFCMKCGTKLQPELQGNPSVQAQAHIKGDVSPSAMQKTAELKVQEKHGTKNLIIVSVTVFVMIAVATGAFFIYIGQENSSHENSQIDATEKITSKLMKETTLAKTGWEDAATGWKYYNLQGQMLTGWQNIDGKDYYFDSTGTMMHDTWVDERYLLSDGTMNTHWLTPDLYVVDSNGIKMRRATIDDIGWAPKGDLSGNYMRFDELCGNIDVAIKMEALIDVVAGGRCYDSEDERYKKLWENSEDIYIAHPVHFAAEFVSTFHAETGICFLKYYDGIESQIGIPVRQGEMIRPDTICHCFCYVPE